MGDVIHLPDGSIRKRDRKAERALIVGFDPGNRAGGVIVERELEPVWKSERFDMDEVWKKVRLKADGWVTEFDTASSTEDLERALKVSQTQLELHRAADATSTRISNEAVGAADDFATLWEELAPYAEWPVDGQDYSFLISRISEAVRTWRNERRLRSPQGTAETILELMSLVEENSG